MAKMLKHFVAMQLFSLLIVNILATTVTLYNNCPFSVWPGILSNPGKPLIAGGGFVLLSQNTSVLEIPPQWIGRFWSRTNCNFDASGHGHCETGDCNGNLNCNDIPGKPPATLVEVTLGNDQDFYDVTLVDGYNIPISIKPQGGSGKCDDLGCVRDLNSICPKELQVLSHDQKYVVGCKSACLTFKSPMYCCTGEYGSPETCKPNNYSEIFKSACPKAYSYAFDTVHSLSTCTGPNYLLTFCP